MSADSIKTLGQILALLPDNTTRLINPQDVRELTLSAWGALQTRDPGFTDDEVNTSGAGFFGPGSRWANIPARSVWECFDGTVGVAIWRQIYPAVVPPPAALGELLPPGEWLMSSADTLEIVTSAGQVILYVTLAVADLAGTIQSISQVSIATLGPRDTIATGVDGSIVAMLSCYACVPPSCTTPVDFIVGYYDSGLDLGVVSGRLSAGDGSTAPGGFFAFDPVTRDWYSGTPYAPADPGGTVRSPGVIITPGIGLQPPATVPTEPGSLYVDITFNLTIVNQYGVAIQLPLLFSPSQLIVSDPSGQLATLGAMGDGQLAIGVGGGGPIVGSITSLDSSITVTLGPGTIDLKVAGGGGGAMISLNSTGSVTTSTSTIMDITGANGMLGSVDVKNTGGNQMTLTITISDQNGHSNSTPATVNPGSTNTINIGRYDIFFGGGQGLMTEVKVEAHTSSGTTTFATYGGYVK